MRRWSASSSGGTGLGAIFLSQMNLTAYSAMLFHSHSLSLSAYVEMEVCRPQCSTVAVTLHILRPFFRYDFRGNGGDNLGEYQFRGGDVEPLPRTRESKHVVQAIAKIWIDQTT